MADITADIRRCLHNCLICQVYVCRAPLQINISGDWELLINVNCKIILSLSLSKHEGDYLIT